MSGGLNLASFLGHNQRAGGKYISGDWKKKGLLRFALHTRAQIYPRWVHTFPMRDVVEDKDTKQPKQIMRYPRFVSPDPEIILKEQHFRNDDATLKKPPIADPFLLSREYLRFAGNIPLNEVVFRFVDPNPKARSTGIDEWTRGEVSGLEKRGQSNFGHSLDAKLEYVFIGVDLDDVKAGVQVLSETQLVGQKFQEAIQQRMKIVGEEGDPFKHPYGFLIEYHDKEQVPLKKYAVTAIVGGRNQELGEDVIKLLTSPEFPDVSKSVQPQPDDMTKIRTAMEAAAVIDLPFDAIFSPDPDVRRALCFPGGRSHFATPRNQVQPAGGQQQQQATQPAAGGRRKVDKPKVETIPCDDCGTPMAPTDRKCAKCGAEYEVDQAAQPSSQGAQPPASGQGGTASPPAGGAVQQPAVGDVACWHCNAPLAEGTVQCGQCGVDQDNIPF